MTTPPCPACNSVLGYEDGLDFVCPECAHEWPRAGGAEGQEPAGRIVRDAVGNELKDGDTVTVIKDLKLKGSSVVVKKA
jgi:protein PhnA